MPNGDDLKRWGVGVSVVVTSAAIIGTGSLMIRHILSEGHGLALQKIIAMENAVKERRAYVDVLDAKLDSVVNEQGIQTTILKNQQAILESIDKRIAKLEP